MGVARVPVWWRAVGLELVPLAGCLYVVPFAILFAERGTDTATWRYFEAFDSLPPGVAHIIFLAGAASGFGWWIRRMRLLAVTVFVLRFAFIVCLYIALISAWMWTDFSCGFDFDCVPPDRPRWPLYLACVGLVIGFTGSTVASASALAIVSRHRAHGGTMPAASSV